MCSVGVGLNVDAGDVVDAVLRQQRAGCRTTREQIGRIGRLVVDADRGLDGDPRG